MAFQTWTDLKQAIENSSHGTFELDAGEFSCNENDGIVLTNKNGVIIRGAGRGKTIVKVARRTQNCIRIGDDVDDLKISDFTIRGEITSNDEGNKIYYPNSQSLPTPNRAISTNLWIFDPLDVQSARNVRNIEITDMEMDSLTTGVLIHGLPDTYANNVRVERNLIHNIYGTASGVGYGISTFDIENLKVIGNEFDRVFRHSIYPGGGIGKTEVLSNLIVRAGLIDGYPAGAKATTIPVARSQNVTVAHNVLVVARSRGISAEKGDGPTAQPPRNVSLINNSFLRYPGHPNSDIWLNIEDDHTVVIVWINMNTGCEVYHVQASDLGYPIRARGNASISQENTGGMRDHPAAWKGTQAMVKVGEKLYVLHDGNLKRTLPVYNDVSMNQWNRETLPGMGWNNAQTMIATRGYPFIFQGGVLYRINPNADWSSATLPPQAFATDPRGETFWAQNFTTMAGTGEYLYILKEGNLYEVHEETWEVRRDDRNSWNGSDAMVAMNGKVFIRRQGNIYRVEPQNWEVMHLPRNPE